MEENSPRLLSIGILTYNSAKYLPRFLDSIRELDYPNRRVRIIFVDNLSNDDTLNYLRAFKNKMSGEYESVLLVSERSNFSQGRNICLEKAMGEFILFISSDVIPRPDTLKHMLYIFSKAERCGIVAIPYLHPSLTLQEKFTISATPNYPHESISIAMGCTLVRLSIFEKIGRFDLQYGRGGEDRDLALRARDAGYSVIYDPTITALHIESVPRQSSLRQLLVYAKYAAGPMAKQRLALVSRSRKRKNKMSLTVRSLFYLAMASSILFLVYGLFVSNPLSIALFPILYIIGFLYQFRKGSSQWRLETSLISPLIGMCLSVGVLKLLLFGGRVSSEPTKG